MYISKRPGMDHTVLLLVFRYCQYEQSSRLVVTSLVELPIGYTIVTLETIKGAINVFFVVG